MQERVREPDGDERARDAAREDVRAGQVDPGAGGAQGVEGGAVREERVEDAGHKVQAVEV